MDNALGIFAPTAERRMIMLKDIDLTNKCGSCCHFKQIEDTATGECLQNPYNDIVVHDPKHPHWIVQRSRIKCPLYNAKPHTNADRIRAMSDEELADMLCKTGRNYRAVCADPVVDFNEHRDNLIAWLKQPSKGE